MLEFVICDDAIETLKNVKSIINKVMKNYNHKYNVITFDDYDDKFFKYVSNNKKAVVYILDIEMPSDSGISVAKHIRSIDKNSIIIILTSHHESADEIYKGRLNILTFISKYDECNENLNLAIEESLLYFNNDDTIEFIDMGNKYTISAKDILYAARNGRKTLIKTGQTEYEVYISLDKLKSMLPNYFKQSHRACLVNMNRVSKISIPKKIIYFDNGINIDYVGDKYKKELVK